MKVVVDRVENGIIVLIDEEGNVIEVDISKVRDKVKENDTLINDNGYWIKDEKETKDREEYIKKLTEDMWE